MIYYCSWCRLLVIKVGDFWYHKAVYLAGGSAPHRMGYAVFRYYRGVTIAVRAAVS